MLKKGLLAFGLILVLLSFNAEAKFKSDRINIIEGNTAVDCSVGDGCILFNDGRMEFYSAGVLIARMPIDIVVTSNFQFNDGSNFQFNDGSDFDFNN